MNLRVPRAAPIIVGVLLLVVNGCGGSASTNVVGPSSTKCEISVTSNLTSVPAAGGTGKLTVATNRECSWSARADAAWISLSTAEGQGPAAVNYTVAANANATPRQGSVVVGEQRVVLTQEAAPCRYDVSPSSRDVDGAGEQISVALTTLNGCAWTARSDAEWIGVARPAAGQGSASVQFDVGQNPGPVRSGTVTLGGQIVRINQAPIGQPSPVPPMPAPSPTPPAPPPTPPAPPTPTPTPAPTCAYTVSPTRKTVAASGEAVTVNVTAASDCSWTARNSAAWISITAGESGSGNGSVQVTVSANGGAARSANLTVAGQSVTLEQSAAAAPTVPVCTYTVAPTNPSAGRDETAITITVGAPDNCTWTAASQAGWITITDGRTGSGNGTARLVVASNGGPSRSGSVIIAGKTLTVQQDGVACTSSIKPGSYHAGRGPDDVSVSVTADDGCAWTAASNASWVSVAEGRAGSGNGTVRLLVEPNSGAPRTASLTIAGRPFTLDQDGPDCRNRIDPPSQNIGSGAADVVVTVNAQPACTWTAASVASWITIADGRGGTGNGSVRLTIASNDTGAPRTGTATIAGETFTVVQAGLTCSYGISPTRYHAGRGPDDVRVNVSAQGGCAWTATGDTAWVSIAEGRTGSGNGIVRLIVQANSGAARAANITIAGQAFTLEQAAGCNLSIKPTNYHSGRGPDDIRITVTADAGCTWTATSEVSWVTVAEGGEGSGTGTVRLLVLPNNDEARSTILTIAGEPFTLRQDGAK